MPENSKSGNVGKRQNLAKGKRALTSFGEIAIQGGALLLPAYREQESLIRQSRS
jgi:hypothetical protein